MASQSVSLKESKVFVCGGHVGEFGYRSEYVQKTGKEDPQQLSLWSLREK